jgi:hypothetical protein
VKRAEIARDAAGLVGCGSVVTGIAMIYQPAAFIAGGLLLIAGALVTARKG